jgi:hypothetical protein
MKLRELTQTDAARCAELEEILFPQDGLWHVEEFQWEFAQPYTFYIGVELDEMLVGYAGMGIMGTPGNTECEIRTIGVDPAYQRRGVGRLLMDNLVHVAESYTAPIFLEVRTDNEPAKAMYGDYGFITVGLRKNYYQSSGADAFVMMREANG